MKEDIKKLGWDAQLLHRQHNQEDITESFFRQEIRKLAEQYANQRVIDEVNEFKLWLYKEYPDKFIDIDITLLYKLFNKLKQ